MFFFKSGQEKNKTRLILDVGSSRVNAVLTKKDQSGKIEILRLMQSESIILPEPNLKTLWRKMSGLVGGVVSEYAKSGFGADEALVVFSSPWYFSEIRNIEKSFDHPTAVTKKDLDEILSVEENNFKKSSASKFGLDESAAFFTGPEIVGAKLNGYRIKPPKENVLDKPAKTFSAELYLSSFFAPAVLDLKRLLSDHGASHIELKSSPEVIFRALSRAGLSDVFVVDVGGEITDIIIIREGEIKKIASFGRGLNYVARRMGPIFNIGLEEIMAMLSNYVEDKLDAVFRDSVSKAIKEAMTEWQNLFEEALEKQTTAESLPSKILVTGHGGGIDEFKKIFQKPSSVISSVPLTDEILKNADHLNKSHLSLIKIYLIYAQ